jgi:endonuclease YncB( thermonuclease family)
MAGALPPLMLCAVVGISDGDMLTVRCAAPAQTLRVRLAQVDAPEKRQP